MEYIKKITIFVNIAHIKTFLNSNGYFADSNTGIRSDIPSNELIVRPKAPIRLISKGNSLIYSCYVCAEYKYTSRH